MVHFKFSLVLSAVLLTLMCYGIQVIAQPAETSSEKKSTVIESNCVAEITFRSILNYADPFNGVTLDVVFTDPQGVERTVPAFWAGEEVWRVRYASPLAGIHTFRSRCSDEQNSGLHGVSGRIVVKPYTVENPLYRHGPIRVADDRRHFAYGDGTPFFWLGDTWWMALVKRLHWPNEFAELVADRKAKGYTVVQLTAGLYGDLDQNFDERAEGDGGFPWTQDFQRINPKYFEEADKRIFYLVEQGIVPCIVGSWGYWLNWLGEEKMKQHWRYLIARWGALPVVWCAAGETGMPWYLDPQPDIGAQRNAWTPIVKYIRDTDPFRRMLTTHPMHAARARDEVRDPYLLDFDMQQSGHGTMPQGQAEIALSGWNYEPVMPSISGEARYENLTIKREWTSPEENLADFEGLAMLGTRQARGAFWAHLLNSGCAGHTYGASGTFQFNREDWKFGQGFSGVDWGKTTWRDAMNLPGSKQLGLAKAMLMTLPWHRMSPAVDLAQGAVSAAMDDAKTCAVIYTERDAVTVDLAQFAGKVSVRWFDPTNGEWVSIAKKAFQNKGSKTFKTPQRNAAGDPDWVVVITSLQK
ncbi:MAG: DUF4038 domain-containing protein [candidate division KSB1 bacterium]|nr:DUF4038 domain-containing protein [candidate division KSB1 bacterium]